MERLKPEIILLDIRLGDLDGREVAQRIRKDPRHAGVRILAMSAYLDEMNPASLKSAGFDDVITKPLDMERLITLITHAR